MQELTQSVVDAAQQVGELRIIGDWNLSQSVRITQPLHICGTGRILYRSDLTPHGIEVRSHRVRFDDVILERRASADPLTQRQAAIYAHDCQRLSLDCVRACGFTGRGAPDSVGSASLHGGFGLIASRMARLRVRDCVFEVSGCAVHALDVFDAVVEANTVEFDGDVLYGINLHENCSLWHITRNSIYGGKRWKGGAINIMSEGGDDGKAPCRDLWIEDNIIEESPGDDSGNAALRVLSAHHVQVRGNTIRQIDSGHSLLLIGSRQHQPGPHDVLVDGNLLYGDIAQIGIQVRNDYTALGGGARVRITNNVVEGCRNGEGAIVIRDMRELAILGNSLRHSGPILLHGRGANWTGDVRISDNDGASVRTLGNVQGVISDV